MKKVFFVFVFFVFSAVCAFAHGANDLIIHGYLVDNICAGKHKNDLVEFVKTHDKTCLLKESSVTAGYSIFSLDDGKLYTFDQASNQAVVSFLKGQDNRVDVVIIAEKNADTLMIEHIANRRIMR